MAPGSLRVKALSSPCPARPGTVGPHSLSAPTFRLSPSPPATAVLLLFLPHPRPSLTPGPLHVLLLLPGTSSPDIHHADSFLFTQALACLSPPPGSPPGPPCLKQTPVSALSDLLQPPLHGSSQHLPLRVSDFLFTYYLPNWNASSRRVWLCRNCSPQHPQGLRQGQVPRRCSEDFC